MNWCAFDCEGRFDGAGVTAGSITSHHGSEYFDNPRTMIARLRWFAEHNYRLVAHRAEYDISVLLWQYGEDVRIVYLNDRFNRGEWRYGESDARAQIWDSKMLSGGLGLFEVGDALKLPKFETPQKLTGAEFSRYKWQCDKHQRWECEECYVTRDSEIVYAYMEAYESFLLEYGVKPQRTIGSAAVALWRAIDNPSPCYLRSVEYAEFARRGYFGGRTECFKHGLLHCISCADVTSMYPAVMLTTPMPNPETTNFYEHDKQWEEILDYPGCSDATIYVPDMYVPPLPMLAHGKLLFGTGTLRGVWCHNEIRHALSSGARLVKLHRSLWSRDICTPFGGFVTDLYNLRANYKRRNDPRQLTVKILLNSLYGRMGLGSNQVEESIAPMIPGRDFSDYRGYTPSWVGDDWYMAREVTRTSIPKYCNVLWASIITAEARSRLHSYLVAQGRALVYCDTDSVLSMLPVVGTSEGLGSLSDDGYWDYARIVAPKVYRLWNDAGEEKNRAKGVHHDVAKDFVEHGRAEFSAPMRPRAALHSHIAAGTWMPITKTAGYDQPKRTLTDPWAYFEQDGYSDTVAPVLLPESAEAGDELPDWSGIRDSANDW